MNPDTTTVEQLYIDPDECIDCDACVEACPVDAIFAEEQLPGEWLGYAQINADYFKRTWGDDPAAGEPDLQAAALASLAAALVALVVRMAEPFEHGAWLVAYLVLVGFLAQLLLGRGQAALLSSGGLPVPSRTSGSRRPRCGTSAWSRCRSASSRRPGSRSWLAASACSPRSHPYG